MYKVTYKYYTYCNVLNKKTRFKRCLEILTNVQIRLYHSKLRSFFSEKGLFFGFYLNRTGRNRTGDVTFELQEITGFFRHVFQFLDK